MENTNMHTRQLEVSYFLYIERVSLQSTSYLGTSDFLLRMYFTALANFNLHGQSVLLVHPYQQESDARKAGNWIFGFSKGLPSCFRLSTHAEMSFLVQNCNLSVCHTDEAQISLPNRNSWLWSSFDGGRWCHCLNHSAIHLEEKTVTALLSSRKWNGMEYLPSLSAIFDIQSWERQMVTLYAYRTVSTPTEKVLHADWREVGKYWIQIHPPSQFAVTIFTPRGYISVMYQFLSMN